MYKKIILLLSTVLISLPLQACGTSQTSTKNEVAVETSNYDIEKGISDDLTSLISKGNDNISPEVEFVNAAISDQKLRVSVSLVYHEQILNEFLFVRDTIKEYLSETDYNISSLNLYSAINGSSDNLTYWYSTDMNTGDYRNGVTDEMIMSCSLESLLSDDKDVVSTGSDANTYNALMISAGKEKEGYFDGNVVDGYASGKGIFYSTNSSGYSYELHANFINGYIDGETELISETGDKVCGSYTMGIKNGTFMYYSHEIGEFSKEYKDGEQIGDVKYIKVNDSYVYSLADQLIQSDDNPASWSDEKIGIAGIRDINSDAYKEAVSNWQNAVEEYEDAVFQSFAEQFGMSKEDVEDAYTKAAMGEGSYTYIGESTDESDKSSDESPDTEKLPNAPSNTTVSANTNSASTSSDSDTDTAASDNGDNFNTYDNQEQQNTTEQYVLNTNTMKIHYPGCSSVPKIAPHNYATSSLSVSELEAQGYTTCGRCF